MIRTILSTVSVAIFAACMALPAGGQECTQCLKPLWQCGSIFVVEIEAVDEIRSPQSGADNVRARVTRVVKDEYRKGLKLEAFDAHLRRYDQPMGGPELYRWESYEQLRPGQQFLIFSDSKDGDLPAMLASPYELWPAAGEADDAVGDIALIVEALPLPFAGRVQAIAAAVTASPKPHGQTLAYYISSLLVAGSDSETSQLANALESAPPSAFSDGGHGALIDGLRSDMPLALQSQHRNMASLFVTLAARYFLIEPEKTSRPLTSAQNLLLQFVHSIATFDPALAAVRALPPELSKQVAIKAAALGGDARLQPDRRAMAVELRALLETKQ